MTRLGAVLLVVSAAVSVVLRIGPPSVTYGEVAPDDLRALTQSTWARFTAAFPARRSCLTPVTVTGAWELGDRARYDPDRALVTVRIPGTAPNVTASLVHEFAHHLDFTCGAHRMLRSAFLAAQDIPEHAPWFGGATWERTPSEHFAEAVTEYVLGPRSAGGRIFVSARALGAIRDWAVQASPKSS